jgi:hypothetical protein
MRMTQPSVSAWCETLQTKLMAALDAVWAILETSDDPVAIRKARDKAKACGDLAAVVRKVVAMTGQARARPPAEAGPALAVPAAGSFEAMASVSAQVEHAVRALEKLKARRRGRA